ncbi:MAG: hypothetical protein LIP00_00365 [Parabacteroides sp.]|nr:hypothetical protein [Parabacteroides sp.]
MNKKTISRILIGLILATAIGATVCYFVMPPWKAFYIACCGGVIVFNFLISLFLVHKNFKK